VAANGRGQFLAAWKDMRGGEADIRLQNVNPDGSLGPLEDTGLPALRPRTPVLLSAWPNPFNPSTTLAFQLEGPGPVRLTIHDLAGREVARLADGPLSAGGHRFAYAMDGAASGLLLARLETRAGVASTKLLMVK